MLQKLVKNIAKLEKGEKVTPKTVGMENERTNFYRFIKYCDNVAKIENEYIKVG